MINLYQDLLNAKTNKNTAITFMGNKMSRKDFVTNIDNMADYFARYMMCPIPILIRREINDIATIMSNYNVSHDAAKNVLTNLKNRRKRYKNKILDFEMPLINLIEKEGGDSTKK